MNTDLIDAMRGGLNAKSQSARILRASMGAATCDGVRCDVGFFRPNGGIRRNQASADSTLTSMGSPASRYSCNLYRSVRILIPNAAAACVRFPPV